MLKHAFRLERLIILFHEKEIALRMILNSFIHFTDTERIITLKYKSICYKKYRDHCCSGDTGNTNCTTTIVTTILHDFPQVV
jgi:hypothetical protein